MIYLDYAAAAPVRPEVLAAMQPYWSDRFAHPSSISSLGVEARGAIEEQRHALAAMLHASPKEVIFTSGPSESILLAARIGHYLAISTERGERPALVAALDHDIVHRALIDVVSPSSIRFIPSTSSGLLNLASLREMLDQAPPWWVSLPLATSDLGTIQPAPEVRRLLRQCRQQAKQEIGPYLHIDASQAVGHLALDVRSMACDFLSFGTAKIGGPKGVGVLFARRATVLGPWQKHLAVLGYSSIRPGTEAVPLIVGLGRALALAEQERVHESARLAGLRDRFETTLQHNIPTLRVVGAEVDRAPHLSSLLIPGVDAEALLIYLDHDGLVIGMGPACQSAVDRPSEALLSLGLSDRDRRSVIRVSIGYGTTQTDLTKAVKILVKRLKWMNARGLSAVDNFA